MTWKLQEYKNMWWAYDYIFDKWIVADREDMRIASVCYINASIFRIDEAFEKFKQWINE